MVHENFVDKRWTILITLFAYFIDFQKCNYCNNLLHREVENLIGSHLYYFVLHRLIVRTIIKEHKRIYLSNKMCEKRY